MLVDENSGGCGTDQNATPDQLTPPGLTNSTHDTQVPLWLWQPLTVCSSPYSHAHDHNTSGDTDCMSILPYQRWEWRQVRQLSTIFCGLVTAGGCAASGVLTVKGSRQMAIPRLPIRDSRSCDLDRQLLPRATIRQRSPIRDSSDGLGRTLVHLDKL